MKQIIITQEDNNVSLKADKGIKWSTFITAIEILIEVLKENTDVSIETILEDIRRIYLRDNGGIK